MPCHLRVWRFVTLPLSPSGSVSTVKQSRCFFTARSPRLPHGRAERRIRRRGSRGERGRAEKSLLRCGRFLLESSRRGRGCESPRRSKACRPRLKRECAERPVRELAALLPCCRTSGNDCSAPATSRLCRGFLRCRRRKYCGARKLHRGKCVGTGPHIPERCHSPSTNSRAGAESDICRSRRVHSQF